MRRECPPSSRRRQRDTYDPTPRDDPPILTRHHTTPTVASSMSSDPKKPRVRFAPPLEARVLSQLGSKTGFLRKQADNEPGKWTKYYFVLKPTTYLYYYNSENDAEPRGIIDMEFLNDIRYDTDCQVRSVGGSANCFRVTGVLPPEFGGYKGTNKTKFRPVYLDTGSRDNARAWMEAFKRHRFDPQKEKDQETLLKTMMVVDQRVETLSEQAKELAALTQSVLVKGEQYITKARGTAATEPSTHGRRRSNSIDTADTIDAVRRIETVLDELYTEIERHKARSAEVKMAVASVKKQEIADYEREQEVVGYKREIERLNLELQHQAQVLALKQQLAEGQERDQEVAMYQRKIENLQRELEQSESRGANLVEREQTIESRKRAVANRLQAMEQECYQRMREINREAQRRAKQQDDEFVLYQYDLLETLKKFAHDPVAFEQYIEDAVDQVSVNARVRNPAEDYQTNFYGKTEPLSTGSKAGMGGYFHMPRFGKKRGHMSSGSSQEDCRHSRQPSSPSSVADTYDTERTSSNSFSDNYSSTLPDDQSVCAEMRRRLPKAWIYQESRVHPGLYFYFNTKTGEMRWTHPVEDEDPSSRGSRAQTMDTTGIAAAEARGGRAQTMDTVTIAALPLRRSTMPLNANDTQARLAPPGMFEMATMNEEDEHNEHDAADDMSAADKAKKGKSWRPAMPKFRAKAKAPSNGDEPDEKYSMLSFIGGPPGAKTPKAGGWKLPKTPFGKRKVTSEQPCEEHNDGSTVF